MRTVSIVEAKAHLSELIEIVASGGEVSITRRGKPVATLSSAAKTYEKVDVELLRAASEGTPRQGEDTADFMRRFRDAERY